MNTKRIYLVAVVVAACLLCLDSAEAKKPDNPGGGGGGGGGELQLVELLPAPVGDDYYLAHDINDSGIVVGGSSLVAGTWDATAAAPTFSPLHGGKGGANAINNAGEIVGWSPTGPRYWANPSANPIDLPLPEGFTKGWANAISSDGVVVGEISDGNGYSAAAWRVNNGSVFGPVVLSPNGGAHDVATLEAGTNRVVGRSPDSVFGHVAAAWDLEFDSDGGFTVTGLTNLAPGHCAEAYAITEAGDLTGIIKWGGGIDNTAFVIRDGSLDLLPSGGRNQYGVGYDLNDTDVVGVTALWWLSNLQIATQWDFRNKREDLTRKHFDDSWSNARVVPQGINGRGDIVGYGSAGAWLLKCVPTALSGAAVPEPSSIILLALALLGFLVNTCRMGPSRPEPHSM